MGLAPHGPRVHGDGGAGRRARPLREGARCRKGSATTAADTRCCSLRDGTRRATRPQWRPRTSASGGAAWRCATTAPWLEASRAPSCHTRGGCAGIALRIAMVQALRLRLTRRGLTPPLLHKAWHHHAIFFSPPPKLTNPRRLTSAIYGHYLSVAPRASTRSFVR